MGETPVVEDLLQRIKQLTGDLEKIRKGYVDKSGPVETSLSTNGLSEVASARADELDTAIEDLQYVAWLYRETATARGVRTAPSTTKLMSRVAEILSALSTSPPLPKPEGGVTGASFIERLIKLMEATPSAVVQKDSAGDHPPAFQKPAEPTQGLRSTLER
jgi:hypothetical protein